MVKITSYRLGPRALTLPKRLLGFMPAMLWRLWTKRQVYRTLYSSLLRVQCLVLAQFLSSLGTRLGRKVTSIRRTLYLLITGILKK